MEQKNAIALVVFDWAGTTVDYGGAAPVKVFDKVFSAAGIRFTRQEINRPMGMEKKEHIRALLQTESGAAQWSAQWKRPWTEADVDALYQSFEEALGEIVAAHAKPIDGVVEAVAALRRTGIRIGSTTGYPAEMMRRVIPEAAQAGYAPECVITPDITGFGRPGPSMLFECMRRMQIYPPQRVVKVGDTAVDIQEGKNAGAWSVGVLTGSNQLGLTREEAEALDGQELAQRKSQARLAYWEAGADFVIDSMAELPELVRIINRRLACGYWRQSV